MQLLTLMKEGLLQLLRSSFVGAQGVKHHSPAGNVCVNSKFAAMYHGRRHGNNMASKENGGGIGVLPVAARGGEIKGGQKERKP